MKRKKRWHRLVPVLLAGMTLFGCTGENGSVSAPSGNDTSKSVTDPSSSSGTSKGLKVGFAKVDITPELPIQLRGQNYDRVAMEVHDPLYATAIALESEDGSTQAVIVSVDNIIVDSWGLIEDVRDYVNGKMEGFTDLLNIVCFATHTHTGPWSYTSDNYPPPSNVKMDGNAYQKALAVKVGEAVCAAWNDRKPGAVSTVTGTAEVGWCRILRYTDGKDVMYGDPRLSTFAGYISGNDHHLNLLYIYQGDALKGVLYNPTFPFQSCETEVEVSADVAGRVRERFPDLYMLPIISAAGDQSPYNVEKSSTGSQMGFSNRDKLGNILADEIEKHIKNGNAAEAKTERLVFSHLVRDISVERTMKYGKTPLTVELHVLRLGDVVLASNPFELYLDYGLAIKARSMAGTTWIGQLSSNPYNYAGECLYLPSAYAEQGKAYGAEGRQVGSEGGAQLVEQTVAAINELFGAGKTALVDCTKDTEGITMTGCTEEPGDGAYGRSRMVMREKGAEITFTFKGTGIKVFDSMAPDKGIIHIWLDGKKVAEVDAYSPITLEQHELYRVTGLNSGEHTLKIVFSGEKNEKSSGFRTGADFFVTVQ